MLLVVKRASLLYFGSHFIRTRKNCRRSLSYKVRCFYAGCLWQPRHNSGCCCCFFVFLRSHKSTLIDYLIIEIFARSRATSWCLRLFRVTNYGEATSNKAINLVEKPSFHQKQAQKFSLPRADLYIAGRV